MALTVQQQQAIALANGRRRKAEAESKPKAPFGSLFYKNAAQGLGSVVDTVGWGLDEVGKTFNAGGDILRGEYPDTRDYTPKFDNSFGGTKSIQRGLSKLGYDMDVQPESRGDRIISGAGQGLGTLPTFLTGTKLLSAGKGLTGKVAKTVWDDFLTRPFRFVSSEAAASAAMPVGGDIAAHMTGSDNPTVRQLGEIGGAVVGGLGPAAVMRAPTAAATAIGSLGGPGSAAAAGTVSASIGAVRKSIVKQLVPYTKQGGWERASARLRELSADPDAQAATVKDKSSLSPAQQTGDERLLALERSVLETDAAMTEKHKMQTAATVEELVTHIKEPFENGEIGDTVDFVKGRADYLLKLLDARYGQAVDIAAARAAKATPERAETVNAAVLNSEADKAYSAARDQERQLWAAVPQHAQVPTAAASAALDNAIASTSKAQLWTIPDVAKRLLPHGQEAAAATTGAPKPKATSLGDQTTVSELHGLYSELRRIQRKARANDSAAEAKNAGDIADAILEDLGATANPNTPEGALINDARTFSHEMHRLFTQDTVGKLLTVKTDQGRGVPPQLTMQATVAGGGAKAANAYDDIENALDMDLGSAGRAGDLAALDTTIGDFMKSQFTDRVFPGGKYSKAAGVRFMAQNRELLDRLPQLRQVFDDAIKTQTQVADKSATLTGQQARISESASARLGDAQLGKEINSIFAAKNPIQAAKSLSIAAARDQSGRATEGLKAGLADFLIQKARKGTMGAEGQRPVSGRELMAMLNDGVTKRTISQIFTKTEVSRIRRIADELVKIESGAGPLPNVGGIYPDQPSRIIQIIARTAAATGSSKIPGGGGAGVSLQKAQILSGQAKRWVAGLTQTKAEEILIRSISDPELFRSLLSGKPFTPNMASRTARSFAPFGFAAVSGITQQEDEGPR